MTSSAENWLDFFDGDAPIYACARHKTLHYARIAQDLAPLLPKGGCVLDHGCGDALGAGTLAARCATLWLFDAAPSVRRRLDARFGDSAAIRVLGEDGPSALPDDSLDLVIANSLLQYLSLAQLSALLQLWRRKLRGEGRLLLADIASPGASVAADAASLLAFAAGGGFLGAALLSLARTFFSDYRRLRRSVGFAAYDAAELAAILADHGFVLEPLPRNIGPNQGRRSFIATKCQASAMAETSRP